MYFCCLYRNETYPTGVVGSNSTALHKPAMVWMIKCQNVICLNENTFNRQQMQPAGWYLF